MSNTEKLQRATEVASSGKQISQPSQDPGKTANILMLRSQLSEIAQYRENIGQADSWLAETENALRGMTESFHRARELSVQGLNDTLSQDDRNAIATEIDAIAEGLSAIGNRSLAGRYVFAGQIYSNPPFAGPVYSGDTGALNRTIAPGIQIDIGVNGERAFNIGGAVTAGDPDYFTMLSDLSTALRSSDHAAMEEGLARIDRATSANSDIVSDVGARTNVLLGAKAALEDTELRLTGLLSGEEDADLAKAIMDLQTRQIAYQSSLGAASQMMQVSLLDFLR